MIYTDAQVQEMREHRAAGWTFPEIAQEWGTTPGYAWYLVNRRGLRTK